MSSRGFIKEVVIENFMSHEYSRIRFEPGLNIITGPNGAGKSSILLAISIAMGQSHTERSKRLSDLIRRGKDYAIVSIILDNSEVGGRKLFPSIRQEEVIVSRVLRKDGQYYFQINYSPATKMEIVRLLGRAGINPDNMLLIMHQNMIETFGFIDPTEKLKLFEEALGISEYRMKILDSRERLSNISKEEEEIKGLFDDATESLKEWEAKYRRLLEKREYEERLNNLYRELAWARYFRIKRELDGLRSDVGRLREELDNENVNLMRARNEIQFIDSEYIRLVEDVIGLLDSVLSMEYIESSRKGEIRDTFNKYIEKMNLLRKQYGSKRGFESVTQYKIELLDAKIRDLERSIESLEGELREAQLEASKYGEEVYSERSHYEIVADIREVKGRLDLYRDIDDSVEATYNYFKGMYNELKKRLEKIRGDKAAAEKELMKRIRIWQNKIQEYISIISRRYNEILSRLNASGYARIVNIDDVDNAGLVLYVGFGGVEPTLMDFYSQSGGERTAAAMAFLLALQQFIKSPFRAIDEFDVHMDPKNREVILEYVIDMMSDKNYQYVLITPGYVTRELEDANIIVVQKVEGISIPTLVKEVS
jgi:chromosome segregation protein